LFVLTLATVVVIKGLPGDFVSIFTWLWIASICWNVEAPPKAHLAFLRDWWIPLALLIVYAYSREIADNLGAGVHVQTPITLDVWLGAGDTPTARLQAALCGSPCDLSAQPHWYDRYFVIVWMSHFLVAPTVAVVFWLRRGSDFVPWMRRYVTISFAALVGYILYPTAPPWMASLDGRLPTDVLRLGSWAWIGPRPHGVGGADPSSWAGNPVAAMPSLHAGVAFLVALYVIQRRHGRWRWAALAYPISMSVALVYLGEHYVTDIVAGALLAVAVLVGCASWERSRPRDGQGDKERDVISELIRNPLTEARGSGGAGVTHAANSPVNPPKHPRDTVHILLRGSQPH
jgi:membrane-associated phospholipid phosphatase